MLPLRKHWHNAPKQAPEREARLLAFANPNAPTAPDPSDPTQSATFVAAPGLNPDGTPIAPAAAPNTAPPVNAAGDVVDQTRTGVSAVLQQSAVESAEKAPASAREIANAMTDMRQQLQSIRDLRNGRPDVGELLRKLPAEEQDMVHNAVNAVDYQWETLVNLEQQAGTLAQWKDGNISPADFRKYLEREFGNTPRGKAMLVAFDTESRNPSIADAVQRWNAGGLEQVSDKETAMRQLWGAIDGEAMLAELRIYKETWEDCIKSVNAEFQAAAAKMDEFHKQKASDKKNTTIWQTIGNIRRNGILGVGLYTPGEYIDAFKRVWQAYTEARKEKHDQQSNKLAALIGGTVQAVRLPYGEQINRRLGSILESEFGKAKNEYKEELGDDSFSVLVGKFHQVKNDPPKAIAVLEAAAGHGWLYDLSDLSDEAWPVHIFGVDYATLVPTHWDIEQTKNYLGTLTRQNTAGGKEQRQKGYDRIKEQQDAAVYVKKFGAMLEGHDYWGAIGIADALLDRGKMTEASEYFTTKFIHHLRNNKEAATYMNKSVLEQFSVLKWNEGPTFSQNMIAMNMKTVQNLRKNRDVMEGPLLSNLDRLERQVRAADPKLGEEEVLRIVAKVLSGQTVTVNNQALSIYAPEYSSYWDESQNSLYGTYKGQPFASKFAVDYYAGATMMQMPTSAVKAIYTTGSTGQFGATEEIALNFAGYAIDRLDELKGSNPGAAEVFRTMMAKKFKDAFEIAFTKSATENLHKYRWKQGNKEGDYMLADLIFHKFLEKEHIVELARGKSDSENFLKQLDEQLADLGRGKRYSAVTPAAPSGPPVNLP